MSRKNVRASLKAYDVLIGQPVSSNGLSAEERNAIIVSAVVNELNETLVLSRFGDAQWDFRPFFKQSNVPDCFKHIIWDVSFPSALIDDCKAVAYAWFKRGMPRSKPPVARGVTTLVAGSITPFIRWLHGLGVSSFSEVRPVHVSNYLHHCKFELKLKPLPLYGRLRIIDLLWVFSAEVLFPLSHYPWGKSTLWRLCGIGGPSISNSAGKTGIIPPEDQAKIFNHCESIVCEMQAELAVNGIGYYSCDNAKIIRARDAVLYIVSITSGMRNDEVIGIEVGSWRREYVDGVLFCWVSTVEHKTGKGLVEYLVPELTLAALELLVNYSALFRKELAQEIRELDNAIEYVGSSEHILRLDKARRDANKMFLARCNPGRKVKEGKHIEALSGGGSNVAFSRLAKAAGSDWPLRTHQCRRTYARCFVESRMGRTSLIFLKWQLKHTTMSMTQLYASNPMQDLSLYDEILQQMTELKVNLIESWLGDQPLAGGAGEKIIQLRAIPVKDRTALLAQTAPYANIRATGHGWCIATERVCGGAGLYEATRCPGCKHSVIDENFAEIWQDIYLQQLELLDVEDAGPAVRQRAQHDLQVSLDVINSLGLFPPAPTGVNSV